MMLRSAHRDGAADPDLRAYLLAEAEGLRDFICSPTTQLVRMDEVVDVGRGGISLDEVYTELSGPVDQLAAGDEYRLRRNDLPDWRPERCAGGPNDEFLLGADDVLRRYDSSSA